MVVIQCILLIPLLFVIKIDVPNISQVSIMLWFYLHKISMLYVSHHFILFPRIYSKCFHQLYTSLYIFSTNAINFFLYSIGHLVPFTLTICAPALSILFSFYAFPFYIHLCLNVCLLLTLLRIFRFLEFVFAW